MGRQVSRGRLYVSALDHVYRFGPGGGPAAGARLSSAPVGLFTTSLRVTAPSANARLDRCSRTRRLRISVRFRSVRVRSVRVVVRGKRVDRPRSRPAPAGTDSALPSRPFTVTIRARSRGGRALVRRTTYSACGRKVLRVRRRK